MRGSRDPKSRFRLISLSSIICVAARPSSWAEMQNLSESIRMVVFDYVRFLYIDYSTEMQNLSESMRIVVFDYIWFLYIDYSSRCTCDSRYSI